MTSTRTRRSSARSTRSTAPSTWKSTPNATTTTPPTVSVVFAEPEQAAPSPGSKSAIASLPVQPPKTANLSVPDTSSVEVETEPGPSITAGNTGAADDTRRIGDADSDLTTVTTQEHQHSPDSNPTKPTPHVKTSTSSWFASLSRRKGKQRAMALQQDERPHPDSDVSIPPDLAPPTTAFAQHDDGVPTDILLEEFKTPVVDIPAPSPPILAPPTRRWFASSSTSTSGTSTPRTLNPNPNPNPVSSTSRESFLPDPAPPVREPPTAEEPKIQPPPPPPPPPPTSRRWFASSSSSSSAPSTPIPVPSATPDDVRLPDVPPPPPTVESTTEKQTEEPKIAIPPGINKPALPATRRWFASSSSSAPSTPVPVLPAAIDDVPEVPVLMPTPPPVEAANEKEVEGSKIAVLPPKSAPPASRRWFASSSSSAPSTPNPVLPAAVDDVPEIPSSTPTPPVEVTIQKEAEEFKIAIPPFKSAQPASRRWFSSSSSSGTSTPPLAAPPPTASTPDPVAYSSSGEGDLSETQQPEPPSASTPAQAESKPPLAESAAYPQPQPPPPPLPSTGRFAISIPFLGRPKMPLDQAVAVARASAAAAPTATSKEPAQESSLPDRIDDVGLMPAQEENPTSTEVAVPPEASSEAGGVPEVQGSSLKDREPSISASSRTSWWGYIGFRSDDASVQQQPQPQQETTPSEEPPSTEEATRSGPDGTAEPTAAVLNGDVIAIEVTPSGDASVPEAPVPAPEGSAWYAPWSWYSQPSAPSGPSDAEASGQTQPPVVVVEEPEPVPESIPALELSNPIQTSISNNKSAWSYLFSAKALSMKTITASEYPKDENGMEVMEVGDDDDTASLKPGGNDTPPLNPIESAKRTKQTLEAGTPGTQTPPTPPATPRTPTPVDPAKADGKKKPSASSSTPSKKPAPAPPPKPPPPNLILPTWEDVFHSPPRSIAPSSSTSKILSAIKAMSGVLFSLEQDPHAARKKRFREFGRDLPRAWEVTDPGLHRARVPVDVLRGCKRVVVIGIHGWFPGTVVRTVIGEPTGTSGKFVNMMVQAIEEFQEAHKVKLQKITKIPLEGEGTIERRVDKLYQALLCNMAWMDDLHDADAIFIATHSQGSIVSTHLLDRLIREGHIRTQRTVDATVVAAPVLTPMPTLRTQKVCCLCLCGIHLGPTRYLRTNSVVLPYIQYFESVAARELFEFQNTESEASKAYVNALTHVIDSGVKMVFVASLNDQVVPVCSALFTAARHPLILRALYIDGDAYNSSDFLSNLLVLLLRIRNSGLPDSGLLAHLSEVTAGSLIGVGHSTAYEELGCYSLAVKYMFLTDDGLDALPDLVVEPFNAMLEQNDYEIPWSLRDLVADERVIHFFSREITELRDAFREWNPKTTILRDVKRKLQPIQRLPATLEPASKL